MKRKKIFVLSCLMMTLAVMMASCSIHNYPTHTEYRNETQVVMSGDNFKVVNQVTGEATVTRVFGIGGVSRRALRENAYADMVANAELKGAQTIVNVTFSVKHWGVPPIYSRSRIIAHGTVIEFTK